VVRPRRGKRLERADAPRSNRRSLSHAHWLPAPSEIRPPRGACDQSEQDPLRGCASPLPACLRSFSACPVTMDVIIVGAGHAGSEAAVMAARLGARTLLLTPTSHRFGQVPTIPAIAASRRARSCARSTARPA